MSEILWSEKPDGTGARLKPRARGVSIPIVDIEDGDVSVALYPSEARSLAAALVAWADRVEPSPGSVPGPVFSYTDKDGDKLTAYWCGSAPLVVTVTQPSEAVSSTVHVTREAADRLVAFITARAGKSDAPPVEPASPKHAAGMCDECGYPRHAGSFCRCVHNVLGRACGLCNPGPPYVETRASRNELLEQLTREQIKSEGLTRELNEARRALEESKKRDAARGDSAPVQIHVSAKTFDSYLSRLAALEAADAQRPNLACVAALESRIEEIEDVDKGAPSTVLAHGRIDEVLKRLTVVENALKAIASAVRT